MGLSGSGKTTLAKDLVNLFAANCWPITWYNADDVRAATNNWDFSEAGRLRQVSNLTKLSKTVGNYYTVTDFIAPTNKIRKIFNADYVIWLDTVDASKYSDTDALFEPPSKVDYVITKHSKDHALTIYKQITNATKPVQCAWDCTYCDARRETGRLQAAEIETPSR